MLDLSSLDQKKDSSGEIPLTCPECNVEIDLDKLFNHLGPEKSYEIGLKLVDMALDDFNEALRL